MRAEEETEPTEVREVSPLVHGGFIVGAVTFVVLSFALPLIGLALLAEDAPWTIVLALLSLRLTFNDDTLALPKPLRWACLLGILASAVAVGRPELLFLLLLPTVVARGWSRFVWPRVARRFGLPTDRRTTLRRRGRNASGAAE